MLYQMSQHIISHILKTNLDLIFVWQFLVRQLFTWLFQIRLFTTLLFHYNQNLLNAFKYMCVLCRKPYVHMFVFVYLLPIYIRISYQLYVVFCSATTVFFSRHWGVSQVLCLFKSLLYHASGLYWITHL